MPAIKLEGGGHKFVKTPGKEYKTLDDYLRDVVNDADESPRNGGSGNGAVAESPTSFKDEASDVGTPLAGADPVKADPHADGGDTVKVEYKAELTITLEALVRRIKKNNKKPNMVVAKMDAILNMVQIWLRCKDLTSGQEKSRVQSVEELDLGLYQLLPVIHMLSIERYKARKIFEELELGLASVADLAEAHDALADFDKEMEELYSHRQMVKQLLEDLKLRCIREAIQRKKREAAAKLLPPVEEEEDIPTEVDTEVDEPEDRQVPKPKRRQVKLDL